MATEPWVKIAASDYAKIRDAVSLVRAGATGRPITEAGGGGLTTPDAACWRITPDPDDPAGFLRVYNGLVHLENDLNFGIENGNRDIWYSLPPPAGTIHDIPAEDNFTQLALPAIEEYGVDGTFGYVCWVCGRTSGIDDVAHPVTPGYGLLVLAVTEAELTALRESYSKCIILGSLLWDSSQGYGYQIRQLVSSPLLIKAPPDLPYGMIRLYRGALVGTMSRGHWYYIGNPVLNDYASTLGYTASASPRSGDYSAIAILQADMPDPYMSAVSDVMSPDLRTDFVLAAVGGVSVTPVDGGDYSIPSSLTAGGPFTGLTFDQLLELMETAKPVSSLVAFQQANVWKSVGLLAGKTGERPHMYRIDAAIYPSYTGGLQRGSVLFNEITLDPSPITWSPAEPTETGPWAHCLMQDGSFNFVKLSSDGDSVSSGSPAVDVSDGVDGKEISLVGDGADVDGLYYADGLGGYDFIGAAGGLELVDNTLGVKVAGSVVIDESGAVGLDGDEEEPTAGKFYGTDPATGALGWHKPKMSAAKSISVNASGEVELDGDEAIPAAGKYYGAHPITGALGWHAGTTLDVIVSIQWNSTNHTLEVKKQTVTIIDAEAVQNWAVVTTAAAGAAQMNTGSTVGHTH